MTVPNLIIDLVFFLYFCSLLSNSRPVLHYVFLWVYFYMGIVKTLLWYDILDFSSWSTLSSKSDSEDCLNYLNLRFKILNMYLAYQLECPFYFLHIFCNLLLEKLCLFIYLRY